MIEQRTPHQCAIATIAMATGIDYDLVLKTGIESGTFVEGEGCRHEGELLEALGLSKRYENGFAVGDFVYRHREWAYRQNIFVNWLGVAELSSRFRV